MEREGEAIMTIVLISSVAFALGLLCGWLYARNKIRRDIADVVARAAIRDADGLPVVGNPMASALIEIDGKEAKRSILRCLGNLSE